MISMKNRHKFLLLVLSLFYSVNAAEAAAILVGRPVTFTGKSVEGADYEWSFPGAKRTGQKVSYTFRQPGTFKVTLTVNKNGQKNSISKNITVIKNAVPTGNISANKTAGTTDEELWFLANFSDPDRDEIQYRWEIEGAFTLSPEEVSDDSKRSIAHKFSKEGRYRIKLRVADGISSTLERGYKESKIYVNIIEGKASTETDVRTAEIESVTAEIEAATAAEIESVIAEIEAATAAEIESVAAEIEDEEVVAVSVAEIESIAAVEIETAVAEIESIAAVEIETAVAEIEAAERSNSPPSVSFYNILPGRTGDTETIFKFYSRATDPEGDPLTYKWKISDGTQYDVKNIAHKFKQEGIHTVTLEVSDGINTAETSADLQVEEHQDVFDSVNVTGPRGNQHTIPLTGAPKTIRAEDNWGNLYGIRIIGRRGPPSTLQITDPQGTTRTITVSDKSQPIQIEDPERNTKTIRAIGKTAAATKEIQSVRISDARGNNHSIPLTGVPKTIRMVDDQGNYYSVMVVGSSGPPPTLQITEATGNKKTIPITNRSKSIQISGPRGERYRTEISEGLSGPRGEIAIVDMKVLGEQLRNMREKKENERLKEKEQEKKKELAKDIIEIDSVIRILKVSKKPPYGASPANPEEFNSEIIRSQLLGVRAQKQKELDQSKSSTAQRRLTREIEILEKLLTMVDEDVKFLSEEKDKLQIYVPQKESDIDTLYQRKAELEAELKKALREGDYERAREIQEMLLALEEELEAAEAALPPPPLEDQREKLQEKKEALEKERAILVAAKQPLLARREELANIKKSLIEERYKKQLELDAETDPEKRKLLEAEIAKLDMQIEEIDEEIAKVNTEIRKIDEKISEIDQEIKKVDQEIREIDKQIGERLDTCENPISVNPLFLKKELGNLKEQKQIELSETTDEKTKEKIKIEIQRIDEQAKGVLDANGREGSCLSTEKINPLVLRGQLTEIRDQLAAERARLEQELANETDPEKRAKLQAQIAALDNKIERLDRQIERLGKILEMAEVDFEATTKTTLFFYARFRTEMNQALLFEWDLGDGRKKLGQNIFFRYPDPGVYEVELTVSGGITTLSDMLVIRIGEERIMSN